jgi:hypothetical protein
MLLALVCTVNFVGAQPHGSYTGWAASGASLGKDKTQTAWLNITITSEGVAVHNQSPEPLHYECAIFPTASFKTTEVNEGKTFYDASVSNPGPWSTGGEIQYWAQVKSTEYFLTGTYECGGQTDPRGGFYEKLFFTVCGDPNHPGSNCSVA